MRARVETAVRPNEGPRPDSDRARVHESGIPVQLCAVPEDDVDAVVGADRAPDPRFFLEQRVVLDLGRELRREWT